jgi:hypothetical protein
VNYQTCANQITHIHCFTNVKANMKAIANVMDGAPDSADPTLWNRRIALISVVFTIAALASVVLMSLHDVVQLPKGFNIVYPMGTLSNADPSGFAPSGPSALRGYTLTYVNHFNGNSIPVGWDVFTGIPGGSPGGQFASSHVVVGGGLLRLNTWKDPRYQNRWVTAGLCQCGVAKTFGAYFVRSKITGAGVNEAQLLWPADNTWPPEIDFNENGGSTDSTSSTVHWGAANQIEQRHLSINLTKWHTWGVVWTPKSIVYVVDGRAWAVITTAVEIPRIPMRLDIEQRTMCQLGFQCPKVPVSMLVDWVVEYSPR